MINNKIIVVLGPTSSGKSDLAVRIALRLSSGQAKKKFSVNGAEIISADSRQVYRGLDIGTGKITKKEMRGIPHYLLDVASPKKRFTVAQYKKLAQATIKKIQSKNKLPILCGGTGFYIQAVTENLNIPAVKPNLKLREQLEKKSSERLFSLLKKIDFNRAENIDRFNKRRLIRAIEIVKMTGRPVPQQKISRPYKVLYLGMKKSPAELKKLIAERLFKRLKQGMIKEVRKLRNGGLSWKRLDDLGLEYSWIAKYLKKEIGYQKMATRLQKEIEHYAKRQMTWFNKNRQIKWLNNYREAIKEIKKFWRIKKD